MSFCYPCCTDKEEGLTKIVLLLEGNFSKILESSRGLADKNSPSSKKAELYKLKLDLSEEQGKESAELNNIKKRLVADDRDIKDRKERSVAL